MQKQVKDLTAERDQLLQQQSGSTANDSSLLEAKGQLESILKEKEGLQTSLTQELERMSSIKAELSGKKTIIVRALIESNLEIESYLPYHNVIGCLKRRERPLSQGKAGARG